jgi:hypothetical protein
MKRHSGMTKLFLVLVAMSTLAPLTAVAEIGGDVAPDPTTQISAKIFDLAMCAVSIATIETGLGATAAVITCGRAAAMWWTE